MHVYSHKHTLVCTHMRPCVGVYVQGQRKERGREGGGMIKEM